MQTIRKSDEKAWADNVDFESEFKDAALVELGFNLDGSIAAGGGSTAQDAALKSIGRLEFNHNGPRISADPRLLFYTYAFHDGGVKDLTGSTTLFSARFILPLWRMCPRGGIDAVARPASWKSRFRAASYLNTTPGTINTTSRVRGTARTSPRAPAGGFRDPHWSQETVKVETASISSNTRKIEFGSDYIVPFLTLMALDASGDVAVTDTSLRVDGLARRITIERFGLNGETRKIVDDISWGALRSQTGSLARWSADDIATTAGIVVIPCIDPDSEDGLMRMPSGSHLVVTVDSSSTVEAGYTAVTPAAGDTLEILVPKFFSREKQTPRSATTQAEVAATASTRRSRVF